MGEVREEMMTVLKMILVRLSDRVEGLRVSNVEERATDDAGRRRWRRLMRSIVRELLWSPPTPRRSGRRSRSRSRNRALETDVSLYYNVYVVRDDDRKFGPIIIDEMRQSYGEIIEQIQ